jgi:hypothetical protein
MVVMAGESKTAHRHVIETERDRENVTRTFKKDWKGGKWRR